MGCVSVSPIIVIIIITVTVVIICSVLAPIISLFWRIFQWVLISFVFLLVLVCNLIRK